MRDSRDTWVPVTGGGSQTPLGEGVCDTPEHLRAVGDTAGDARAGDDDRKELPKFRLRIGGMGALRRANMKAKMRLKRQRRRRGRR